MVVRCILSEHQDGARPFTNLHTSMTVLAGQGEALTTTLLSAGANVREHSIAYRLCLYHAAI